jgi:hypothetical protein
MVPIRPDIIHRRYQCRINKSSGEFENKKMSKSLPRCRVIPLPDHQVAFEIDGTERARWHYGASYPRPFFYPLLGPSRQNLTRMGHPGAPNHDHHRSIWFAHADLQGNDFWSEQGQTRIEQLRWLAYQDGDDEALMAVTLGWFDAHGTQLIEQELVAAVRPAIPAAPAETNLELQATFHAVDSAIEFGKSNFGFLGVRVARSISVVFGGGIVTDSEGRQGEQAIFAKNARWVDYSGPVGGRERPIIEGITYCDHPENVGYPTAWHVRDDGWMCCSACMNQSHSLEPDQPLRLRYLIRAHAGPVQRSGAEKAFQLFERLPAWEVVPSQQPHTANEIRRQG